MKKIYSIVGICGVLAACGGGSGGDKGAFGAIGFDSMTPTRSGIDKKIQDYIDFNYLIIDRREDLVDVKAWQMPQKSFTVKGNVLTLYDGNDDNRGIIGDVLLNIDVTKPSDHITGSADNFIIGTYSYTGNVEDRDLKVNIDKVFYTTKGALAAYGEVYPGGASSLGFSGSLDVLENGEKLDTVNVDSEGIAIYQELDGDRVLIGALATSVKAKTNQDLDLDLVGTILWAK